MASITKRRTIIQTKPSIDRISNLPDNLHTKILSLLPTKEAVKTSVLSTKWRFTWTSITKLDFHNSFIQTTKVVSTRMLNMKKNMFTQFVNRVLLLLNSPHIQNFRLTLDDNFKDIFYLNSWISAAIVRNVKDLDLILKLAKPIDLPLTHFYCNTLVVLKLLGDIHFKLRASTTVCFPSLQTLHLNQTTIEISGESSVSFPKLEILKLMFVICVDEDSAHQLLSNCPVLDHLVIHGGDWENVRYVIISIPSLTRLLLRLEQSVKLQIDTPRLQYLDLEDSANCEYLNAENYFSSLLEAEVNFDFDIGKMGVYAKIYCTAVFKFIEGLSRVKFLGLLGGTLKAIGNVPRSTLPGFQNVVRLELENDQCLDWQVIIKNLLQSMNNLEHIVMKGRKCNGSHESWWIEPLNIPKCLLCRVRCISCTNMNDCRDEFELLRYFLEKGKVLKLLQITSDLTSDENFKLAQKVSMFPRGSPTCQVEFE